MGEHSPTPWRWEGMSRLITASDNSTVGALNWSNDNAEAIHCVNVHDDLVKALEELVSKLETINADPQFKSIWALAANRGMPYTGPNYVGELGNARAALAKAKAGA